MKAGNLIRNISASFAIVALAGCASQKDTGVQKIYDPLEPVNRAVFSFNTEVDRFVLKPIAQGYTFVVPRYGRARVTDFFRNLNMPIIFVNSVLQADPENAFASLWTFIFNTTFGVAGLWDWAGDNTDIQVRDEDTGQTLGVYAGGATGPYLVLPFIGPSNVRDAIGFAGDIFIDPIFFVDEDSVIISLLALNITDSRANNLGRLEEIYETSFDPYATIRSGYLQRRAALVENRAGARIEDVDTEVISPVAVEPTTK
jgi:phospholipid-binding lipoprotein MlaA